MKSNVLESCLLFLHFRIPTIKACVELRLGMSIHKNVPFVFISWGFSRTLSSQPFEIIVEYYVRLSVFPLVFVDCWAAARAQSPTEQQHFDHQISSLSLSMAALLENTQQIFTKPSIEVRRVFYISIFDMSVKVSQKKGNQKARSPHRRILCGFDNRKIQFSLLPIL